MKTNSIFSTLFRVYRLLNQKERKRSLFLLLCIFVNSIVEILGLAVIIPVIGLVVQPETIQTNPVLKTSYDAVVPLGINTPSRFLIGLCFLMIGAFLFKALFGLAVNLFQKRFSYSVAHRLSGQVWAFHFRQSLEQMRSVDSGRILTEINHWPIQFANAFLVGNLLILTEFSVFAILAVGIILYNPIVFLSIAILLSSGGLIIRRITKRRIQGYGDTRRILEPRTNTLINDALRGFLEVVTFHASDAVRDLYMKERRSIFRVLTNTSVLLQAPAKLYEVLAVTAVAGSIIIALFQGLPEAGFLELLSILTISAYRIMPSMTRINSAILQLQAERYTLECMEKGVDFERVDDGIANTLDNTVLRFVSIHLQNVSLTYLNLKNPVIKGMNHSFEAGRINCIIGPSGSGKSTIVNSLLGLHKPSAGSIIVDFDNRNKSVYRNFELHEWLQNIGYVSQEPFLFKGTLYENLTLRVPGREIDEEEVQRLIVKLGLEATLGLEPLKFQISEGGGNLSGGQKQRIALLRALQMQRPILILDEATSALDAKLRGVVVDILNERVETGCTVIVVTHDMELAARCDTTLNLST